MATDAIFSGKKKFIWITLAVLLCTSRLRRLFVTTSPGQPLLNPILTENVFPTEESSTTPGSSLCQNLLQSDNIMHLWQRLQLVLINASLPTSATLNDAHLNETTWLHNHPLIRQWTTDSWAYYDANRMERTMMHPPDSGALGQIMQLIQDRLNFRQTGASPLRIAILGGSVTAGRDCAAIPFDPQRWTLQNLSEADCAWPKRLHDMMNAWLRPLVHGGVPPEQEGEFLVVEIKSMAMPSTTSDIGAMVVAYEQWPPDYPLAGPHVLVYDYSVNDLLARDVEQRTFEDLMTTFLDPFVQAARGLRCHYYTPPSQSEDSASMNTTTYKKGPSVGMNLPLLIFMDDFVAEFRDRLLPTVQHHGMISMLIHRTVTWYRLWGISPGQSMRPYVYQHYDPLDKKQAQPLFGSTLDRHLGFMFHSANAWIFMYNWLSAMQRHCQLQHSSASLNDPLSANSAADATEPATSPTFSYINSNMLLEDLPFLDLPPLSKPLSSERVRDVWRERAHQAVEECASGDRSGVPVCFYVWTVNRLTNVQSDQDIHRRIAPYLISQAGWQAEGRWWRSSGFVARGQGATFAMVLEINKAPSVRYLTIIAMQSYSEDWVDSNINVVVTVIKQSLSGQGTETKSFDIPGYHEIKTSVLVPHKFAIPLAEVGDHVHLNFTLSGGLTAKISGMALCNR